MMNPSRGKNRFSSDFGVFGKRISGVLVCFICAVSILNTENSRADTLGVSKREESEPVLPPMSVLSFAPPEISSGAVDLNEAASDTPAPDVSLPILRDFTNAQRTDINYAIDRSNNELLKIGANVAALSYTPNLRLSMTQLPNEQAQRRTLSISQPLLSWERWLSLKEREPKEQQATLKFYQAQQDLAKRMFGVLKDVLSARERLSLNQYVLDTLQIQLDSAKKMYEAGVGTLTDIYDVEVRINQTQAERLLINAELSASRRKYESVVGYLPKESDFPLRKEARLTELPDSKEFLGTVMNNNISVQLARLNQQLGELNYQKTWAQNTPSLVGFYQKSMTSGREFDSTGLRVIWDLPVDPNNYLRFQSADIERTRLADQTRSALLNVELDFRNLADRIQALAQELRARRASLKLAQLSLEGNQKSFEGGVRSRLDVLTAIRTVYGAELDYVRAMLDYASNYMDYLFAASWPVEDVLGDVQLILFDSPLTTDKNN